tara:strand:- start:71 stop:1174 length:1104 start_codon:yes stop_codon:yes gene_type:complete
MAKVYDAATGYEIKELGGRFAGTKYLVDEAGTHKGNLTSVDAGVNWDAGSSSGVADSSSVYDTALALYKESNLAGSGADASGSSGSGANTSGSAAAVAAAPVIDYSRFDTGFANVADAMGRYNTESNTNFDAVNSNLSGGFDQMGNRFNTVDQNVGNVQGAVDQGFVNQAAGFSDAQIDRSAQAAAAQADRNTQFADTGEALNAGFGAATDQLTETQANVMAGQTGLGTTLQTMGDTADIYAGQSLENQAAMQSGIDTQASTFDDYIDRYSDDTQFAQDNRRDLASAQSNFADEMADNAAMYNDNVGQKLQAQQLKLVAIRDQQLSDAAAAAEATYQNSLSQLQLGANAQSGNPVPAGLGSPYAVTQ